MYQIRKSQRLHSLDPFNRAGTTVKRVFYWRKFMISYTDGSWSIDKFGNIIAGGDILPLGGVSTPMTAGASKDEAKANASRIVACVNACAGVDTELLEEGELDNPVMKIIKEKSELKKQCDELLAVLDEISKLPSYRQDECSEMARDAIAKANGGAS